MNTPPFPFLDTKQERSKQTLENILEAAHQIVEEANPDIFTSRMLAKKSGYGLGTLTRRLSSIEHVFLWAIYKARERKFEELSIAIGRFDADVPIQTFAQNMVDTAFSGIAKVNPSVMRFFENRFTKMHGLPSDYFAYMDSLAEPYLEAASKNKTDTFRVLTKNEAYLLIRQLGLLIERPFVEGNPIAGTDEHRELVIDTIIRLLGK